ncbi:MAG: transglycosylase domain-containing protein [Flexilinea sp.]|nr:transglycosylase domain-containing protein [Flexilinea sp.]
MERKNELHPTPPAGLNLNFEGEQDKRKKSEKQKKGCLKPFLILLLVFLLFLFVGLFCLYTYIVMKLPDVSDLRAKASQFETLRIMDRQQNLLYEVVPPEAGRRDYVTLDEISPYVLAAVIAVEDQDYYNHPGFDVRAIVRAFFQNAESGETVSGASTITQQLTRNLLMSQTERYERTVDRKIKEIILAAEITRRYSKDEILEIYLNENYYGNHAYGIEAAAQTYFKKSAKNLDLGEAAFLAGLPQAPGYYDIFSNRAAVLARFKTVLLLSYNLSAERGCLSLRNGAECVKIDPVMVSDSIWKIENFEFVPGVFMIKYPHWVNYIYQMLETKYGADSLYRSGYTVYTTLDPQIQDIAEQSLKDQIDEIQKINVHNGAVIVMDPKNGDILAMVGSPDFQDTENAGQVNMSVSPRQPGSAIKPLIYAAAFEKGWTPATLIWDVETDFSPTGKQEDLLYSPPYHPTNYDGLFHGPVLAREALGSSLNIPAVKALEYVGLYDEPETETVEGFIPFAKRLHVDSLDKPGYGLAVSLGGGEVTLLELTNAYAVFANNGEYIPARGILKITDHQGQTIYDPGVPVPEKVLNEEYAYQISSILSDDNARILGFGQGSILNLSFPAAVKTGTTNDYKDNWTIGYNAGIVVGVWVGNADNRPMTASTGVTGAAPVWHNIMEAIAAVRSGIRNAGFNRPQGIEDVMICADSGTRPGANCNNRKWEVFAKYQPPLSENEGFISSYYYDSWSGKLVSADCVSRAELKQFLNVREKEAQNWIKGTAAGRQWAEQIHAEDLDFIPEGEILYPPCGYPIVELVSPADGTVIRDDHVDITAVIYALDGVYPYSVEFARAEEPENWMIIANNLMESHYEPGAIADWYTYGIEDGNYFLRIRMIRENGQYFEKVNHVRLERTVSETIDWPDQNFDYRFLNQPVPEKNEGTVIQTDQGEIYISPENH